jgi:hypothetical protein
MRAWSFAPVRRTAVTRWPCNSIGCLLIGGCPRESVAAMCCRSLQQINVGDELDSQSPSMVLDVWQPRARTLAFELQAWLYDSYRSLRAFGRSACVASCEYRSSRSCRSWVRGSWFVVCGARASQRGTMTVSAGSFFMWVYKIQLSNTGSFLSDNRAEKDWSTTGQPASQPPATTLLSIDVHPPHNNQQRQHHHIITWTQHQHSQQSSSSAQKVHQQDQSRSNRATNRIPLLRKTSS